MKLGLTFPQTEIGNDPSAIRTLGQGAEELGFDFIACYDHVVGAHPDRTDTATERAGPLRGPYTHRDAFHEPFVLFGYLAAVTQRIELFTHVLVLPQRQTVLAAKQAVEVDLLSGGRLRLGVAVGWNPVEYAALGVDFHRRGRRLDEQLQVLGALWGGEVVELHLDEHLLDRASLNPAVQHDIPLWFGGGAEATLRRTAVYGAGWMPNVRDLTTVAALRARLEEFTMQAGRDPATIGQLGTTFAAGHDDAAWDQHLRALRETGFTHVTLSTMGAGLATVDEHLATAARFLTVAQANGVD
jgi:probable F420-dependent oxidoreductase